MIEDKAKQFVQDIEKKAEKHGQHVDIHYNKTPKLKNITITVSVRVTEK